MGYRSDVTVVIYGEKDDVTAFVAGEKIHGKPKGLDHHPLDEPTSGYHERHVYDYGKGNHNTMMEFNWWDVKWYDSYPEVNYWTNLASVWEEAFPRLSMEFVRVGEEVDDNITNYYGDDCQYHLNISREITKSLP